MINIQKLFSLICLISMFGCEKPSPDIVQPDPSQPSMEATMFAISGTRLRSISVDSQKVKWETTIPYYGLDLPCYDSGFLFIANVYGAVAVNANTGAIQWTIDFSARNYIDNDLYYRTMPVVVDSIVYATGFTGNTGQPTLYAIHKVKGSLIWKKILAARFASSFSRLLISKDKILLYGMEYDSRNRLFCINRLTGATVWEKLVGSAGIFPSPYSLADENLIYLADVVTAKISALDVQTGDLRWSTPVIAKISANDHMVLKGNTLTVFADRNQTTSSIYHLEKNTGAILKQFDATPGPASLDVRGDTVFLQSDLRASAYSLSKGSYLWSIDKPARKAYDSLDMRFCSTNTWSWTIFTDNELVSYLSAACPVNAPVCIYNKLAFIDKASGKVSKEIDLMKMGCHTLSAPAVLLKDGNAYYPNSRYW